MFGEHLACLEIARWLSGNRTHHAAAHIGDHRCELGKRVIAHLLHIPSSHKSGFDSLDAVAEFGEGERLAVVEALPVSACHRHRGCLIEALIQQQGEQGGEHPGVVVVVGVAKPGKHRRHVFGRFDVLPFDVVNPRRYLDIRREAIQHSCCQQGCEGAGMAEIGGEAVVGIAQCPVAVKSGEESQVGDLLTQHIRLVGDVVMAE